MSDKKQPVTALPDTVLSDMTAVWEGVGHLGYAEQAGEHLLKLACLIVADRMNIDVPTSIVWEGHLPMVNALHRFSEQISCKVRRVHLSSTDWKYQSIPMIVFDKQSGEPFACIAERGHMYVIDPVTSKKRRVTKAVARSLFDHAYVFYHCLPDEPLTVKSVFLFGLKKIAKDLKRILHMEAVVGIFALLTPIIMGVLFEYVVPSASGSLLVQLIAGLVCAALGMILFRFVQVIASVRLQMGLSVVLATALWDRLLRLPCQFFRQFSVGDLENRSRIIDYIQGELSSAVISALLGGLFAVFTFCLMLYYSVLLTLVLTAIVFVIFAVTLLVVFLQRKHWRRYQQLYGEQQGIEFQLLNNIAKLKVANAEANAYRQWTMRFFKKARELLLATRMQGNLATFDVFILSIATMLLFFMVAKFLPGLSFGKFIAFNAAFGQFFGAVSALTQAAASLVDVVPYVERIKPLLEETPETTKGLISPQSLSGNIHIQHLSFRYTLPDGSQGPWIWRDVNLDIKAGEFVALVGPSGSGKSTLLRLLLGFETPQEGSITYDRYALPTLNKEALRAQLGVVMQDHRLLSSSIWDYLMSGVPASEEKIWSVLKQVTLEKEIKQLPMGLQTLMSDSAGNFSVGQRQRLTLARVLLNQPRILLLDEATSALDNASQAIVMDTVSKMKITRIVIAHRLSTLKQADRVFELKHGTLTPSIQSMA